MSEAVVTEVAVGTDTQDVAAASAGGCIWLTVLKVVLALLVIAIIAILNALGPFLKYIIEKYGSKYLKTKITVKSIAISLTKGIVEVKGVEVANPTGFSDSNIAQLGSLSVRFSPRVWKKPFIVHSVIVTGTNVTYEVNLSGTNVGALLSAITPPAPPKEEQKQAEKPAEKPLKEEEPEKSISTEEKSAAETTTTTTTTAAAAAEEEEAPKPVFLIELVEITDTWVSFGAGSTVKVPIPLIPIKMTNVGASTVSSLIYDIVAKVCESIFAATGNMATAAVSATCAVVADTASYLWNWATGSSASTAAAAAAEKEEDDEKKKKGEEVMDTNDGEVPMDEAAVNETPLPDEEVMNANDAEVPMGEAAVNETPIEEKDSAEVPMDVEAETPIME